MLVRLNFVLGLILMLCALWLVRGQYESRRLYTELDREVAVAKQFQTDSDSLGVMLRAQAAAARVDAFAKVKMQMRVASPALTRYVAKPQVFDQSELINQQQDSEVDNDINQYVKDAAS